MSKRRRGGFSLLEIILAMAILLGAVAVLGELTSIGMRNSRLAEAYGAAQLLCESTIEEIVAGHTPPEPVRDSPIPHSPGWLYSVETEPAVRPGMSILQVTIRQDVPENQRPVEVTLTRWIRQANAQDGSSARSQENRAPTPLPPMDSAMP